MSYEYFITKTFCRSINLYIREDDQMAWVIPEYQILGNEIQIYGLSDSYLQLMYHIEIDEYEYMVLITYNNEG